MPVFDAAPRAGIGVRVVESQSHVATLALVDTLDEQALLEDLLEATKPGPPVDPAVHYLMATPFRYPPLDYGSRYGNTDERGIFYGSERIETALSETAFYALLFTGHSEGITGLSIMKTAFEFRYDAARAIDTTSAPFESERIRLDHPRDYAASQRIGRSARAEGVQLIRFRSVRCPDGGANLALLDPDALSAQPASMRYWQMRLVAGTVQFLERDAFLKPRRYTFKEDDFIARGVQGHPARAAI